MISQAAQAAAAALVPYAAAGAMRDPLHHVLFPEGAGEPEIARHFTRVYPLHRVAENEITVAANDDTFEYKCVHGKRAASELHNGIVVATVDAKFAALFDTDSVFTVFGRRRAAVSESASKRTSVYSGGFCFVQQPDPFMGNEALARMLITVPYNPSYPAAERVWVMKCELKGRLARTHLPPLIYRFALRSNGTITEERTQEGVNISTPNEAYARRWFDEAQTICEEAGIEMESFRVSPPQLECKHQRREFTDARGDYHCHWCGKYMPADHPIHTQAWIHEELEKWLNF